MDTDAATRATGRFEALTFRIGGDLPVHRLGFGAMQLTGDGVWGMPDEPEEAKRVLRRAVELGVDFIDTADAYGPDANELLIADALRPYPDGLVVATKGGIVRPGPGRWVPDGRPKHLRAALEGSLRRLGVDRIDLYQWHAPDPRVPFEDSVRALAEFRDEGLVRHVGLSNVSVDQLDAALDLVPVATVQNRYNLADRDSSDVLRACEERGIGFIPWFPLATGGLAKGGGPVAFIAERHDAAPAHVALAWLLQTSPVTLPIPGTSSLEHLEQNLGAADLRLTDDDVAELDALTE